MAKSVKVLVAIAAVGALYSAAAWYMGREIEAHVREGHQGFSGHSGLAAELTEYRRGLFHATAHSQLRLPGEWGGGVVAVVHRIAHGPLPGLRRAGLATIDSEVELPASVRAAIRDVPATASPYTLRTDVGYRGDASLQLTGLPWSASLPDGTAVAVQPANAHLQIGAGMRELAGRFEWGGLKFNSGQGGVLQIQGVQGQHQFTLLPQAEYSYVGKSHYAAQRLHIANLYPAEVPYAERSPYEARLEALVLEASASSDAASSGEWLDLVARLTAEQAELSGQAFGPLRLDAGLRRLHVPTYEALYPRLTTVIQHEDPAAAFAQLPLAEQTVLRDQAAALLGHGLHLAIDDLGFHTPRGAVRLQGHFEAPEITGIDLQFLPLSLVAKLHARLVLDVPEALAQQWQGPDGVDLLVEQGLLQRDGTQVRTTMEYKAGVSTINGQPFNPAGIGQLLR